MRRKGFTLVEVILSIAILGMISGAIITLIAFGFTRTRNSRHFTSDMYTAQMQIEQKIEEARDKGNPEDISIPGDKITKNVFGKEIKSFKIEESIKSLQSDGTEQIYGKLYSLVPNRMQTYSVPKYKNNPHISVSPTASSTIDILQSNNTLTVLFDDKTNLVSDTDWLMSVYRYYITGEMPNGVAFDPKVDRNYIVIKEYNAARTLLSYKDSEILGFIPNIKQSYNILKPYVLMDSDKLDITITEYINRFGNRYIFYGVTPYSIDGKIGEEVFSNLIYAEAPRLKIESSLYKNSNNTATIIFNRPIKADVFDTTKMEFNEQFGSILSVVRNTSDNKELIVSFEEKNITATSIPNNKILTGAIEDDSYGAINIINGPDDTFTITVEP